jgi:hypothetical protein
MRISPDSGARSAKPEKFAEYTYSTEEHSRTGNPLRTADVLSSLDKKADSGSSDDRRIEDIISSVEEHLKELPQKGGGFKRAALRPKSRHCDADRKFFRTSSAADAAPRWKKGAPRARRLRRLRRESAPGLQKLAAQKGPILPFGLIELVPGTSVSFTSFRLRENVFRIVIPFTTARGAVPEGAEAPHARHRILSPVDAAVSPNIRKYTDTLVGFKIKRGNDRTAIMTWRSILTITPEEGSDAEREL